MASDNRPPPDALRLHRELEEGPHRFDFFQVLRRLENAHRAQPRIGTGTRLRDEFIRLGQDPSLAFAPASLSSYEPTSEGLPRLGVAFFGLFGPNGPLPLHLTEYARDRLQNEGDATFARFADLFHHRMLALFYRAWAQAQPAVSFDRPELDRFGDYVGSLLGIGVPELKNRDAAPDGAKRHYSGHLSSFGRCADGLADLLADYLEVPVSVREFRGNWIDVPVADRTQLGSTVLSGNFGEAPILGSRFHDYHLSFQVVCGPMRREDFERLLPNGASLDRMKALVRSYVGQEYLWDVRLVLAREEVKPLTLGGDTRLGWTSWLFSGEFDRDSDDLVLNPDETVSTSSAQRAA